MFRFLIIASTILWLSAMSSLFVRDVLPAWTAQEAPAITQRRLNEVAEARCQFSIRDPNRELGKAWSDIQTGSGTAAIHGTLLLEPIGIIPRIRIESTTEFDHEGGLDSFSLDLYGVPYKVCVKGERRGPYFPCELQVGARHMQASLDLAASRLVGDSFRPFAVLPTLRVGQSWRMQMLNPLTMIISRRAEFTPVVAKVTRRESIPYAGGLVECFVVETVPEQVKAWVDDHGGVLRQEMDMPGLGRVIVQAEPYDENARDNAKKAVRSPLGSGVSGGSKWMGGGLNELGD
jgi:hypothetical protein